jgi:dTMP kinase
MPGRFVVLEGGDGSGKTTQVARLAATLRARGIPVLETFEPGAGSIGKVLRELLLHGPDVIAPMTEALLMAADRAQHVATEVAPALARGDWVVCDRYVPSSLVYQGVVRGLGVARVQAINEMATGGLAPDLVVVLDLDDRVAHDRRAGEADRLEREGLAFHAKVREAYRALATENGWVVVDGSADADTVAREVETAASSLIVP